MYNQPLMSPVQQRDLAEQVADEYDKTHNWPKAIDLVLSTTEYKYNDFDKAKIDKMAFHLWAGKA